MRPVAIVVDDFLDDFDSARTWLDTADFQDVTNPVDGVVYPDVCLDIPPALSSEVVEKVEDCLGRQIKCNTMFVRFSFRGRVAPHQAHTDISMGEWSLMLYLNRKEHCAGGTSLLRHVETGAETNPESDMDVEIWKRDTNRPGAWEHSAMCGMKPNRAMIFPAYLYHRAEPIGGFGDDKTNGRVVLTMFFEECD